MEDDEGEDAVATEMRGPDEPTHAMRKHHQLTHIPFQAWCEQSVQGRAPDLPIEGWEGREREEIVIQTDYCFMKTKPQDDLITTLVSVDDSSGRCVAICVEREGARDVLGVKAWAAFARSLGQPRLIVQSDGEHSIVELFRHELARASQQVTPTASKGSNGRVEQANRAIEGMTRLIMSCLANRYDVEAPIGSPSCAMGDPARGLAVGTVSTRRRWLQRVLPTVPEELPKCFSAVSRDRTVARSTTSYVETSIQVGLRSAVGEVSGERQPRDRDSRWMFHGEKCATNAAKFTTPKRYSSTPCARRNS